MAFIFFVQYLKFKTKGNPDFNEASLTSIEVKNEPKTKLYNIKIKNLPFKAKKKDIKELLNPLAPASIRFMENIKGVVFVGFKTEKEMRQAMVKNKTFLSKKLNFNCICIHKIQNFKGL